MKFVVSSSAFLSKLQAVSKVINSKNTMPMLDNFLFNIQGNELTITASDLETTLISKMELENVDGEGIIAIEAKRLTDILKEFPEQPLTFEINMESMGVDIFTENGKFSIVGLQGDDFPKIPELEEETASKISIGADIAAFGILKASFATADDELRPVMNGIFVHFSPEGISFVATDAHKLIRYRRLDATAENEGSFILNKKPASLLKNLLPKDNEVEVKISFTEKNAVFEFLSYKLICQLIEGKYPNYESIIPADNQNKMIVDRVDLYNSIKRVAIFSNQASNLVKLSLKNNQVDVSAQDIDFSISAYEKLNCQYDGAEMEIGFKSSFLMDLITNLPSTEVVLEMSDPSKATLLFPFDKENESEDILMLIMPMMV